MFMDVLTEFITYNSYLNNYSVHALLYSLHKLSDFEYGKNQRGHNVCKKHVQMLKELM